MTEIARATCPTCAAALPAAGTVCARCGSAPSYGAYGGYPGQQPSAHPSMPPTPAPFGYQQHQAPYPQMPYQQAPYQPVPYQAPPAPMAYGRPVKSAGVAILLTVLWIGAGHLYLGRTNVGLALMAAHFVLGIMVALLLGPLSFVLWLGAVVWASVYCSNLAGEINAGTAPPLA